MALAYRQSNELLCNIITKQLIFFIVLSCNIQAQPSKAQEISIGEQLPEMEIRNVLNYSSDKIKLADLKDKLIILDFWATNCVGCILSFPKMESLQKQFGKEIQILLVTKQQQNVIENFFIKHKKVKMPSLPIITNDSVLSNLFPYATVPHHVWIDKNRIVRAITHGYNATAENIGAVLENKKTNFSEKRNLTDYDWTNSPLIAGTSIELFSNVQFYSSLMKANEELPGIIGMNKINGSTTSNRIYANKVAIVDLFRMAFSEGNKYNLTPRNTIILEVKDSFKYIYPSDKNLMDEWRAENSYGYELLVPPSKSKNLYIIMQDDLMRYFDVEAKIEKKEINCLVLVKTDEQNKAFNENKIAKSEHKRRNDTMIFINQPLKDLSTILKSILDAKGVIAPFIDQTHYSGTITLDLFFNRYLKNRDELVASLRKQLQRHGLDLVEKKSVTNVLVIKERNSGNE